MQTLPPSLPPSAIAKVPIPSAAAAAAAAAANAADDVTDVDFEEVK